MIKNKLGILNINQLKEVEKEIIAIKIKLLDERITFNMSDLNLDFLIKIHQFLFCDIYYDDDIQTRYLDKEDLIKIEKIFKLLVDIGVSSLWDNGSLDLDMIQDLFIELWEMQIFCDGNTRTLLAFLKIYIGYYCLPIKINDMEQISSCSKMFVLRKCQQKTVDNI